MSKPKNLKKLGLAPAPKRTKKVLRQRVSHLRKGLKEGRYSKNMEAVAKHYLSYFQRELEDVG